MKKIIAKLIIIVLVISIIPIFPNAEDKPEKGDLRCPNTSAGRKYCKEFKDSSGKVYKVEVTQKVDDISITKIVTRTEKIGQYTVQFYVQGKTQPMTAANIYLVLDASHTMGDNYYNKVVPAVVNLSKQTFKGSNPVNFGYVTFRGDSTCNHPFDHRDLKTENFVKEKFKDNCFSPSYRNKKGQCIKVGEKRYVDGSPIHTGLCYAINVLKKQKNANNYLIVLGDGIYDEMDYAVNQIEKLKKLGVEIWAWDYSGQHEENMKKLATDTYHYSLVKKGNYEESLMKIAEQINKIILEVSLKLEDIVGPQFSVINNGTTSFYDKDFKIYSGWYTDEFAISIDNTSSEGWHTTNGDSPKAPGYKVTYNNGSEIITKTLSINPEVYWEPEKGWESCSDFASSSIYSTYVDDFIEKKCSQTDGDGIKGFYALLTTNGQPINTKKINLGYATGFPINIDIQSRVQCTYKFDVDKFKTSYNKKQQEIVNSKNAKDLAEKTKELKKMIEKIESYVNESTKLSNLNEYQENIKNISATLQVKYKNSSNMEQLNFQISKVNYNNIDCSVDGKQTKIKALGKEYNIYTQKTCTLKSSVSMTLPTTCLSMIDGYQEECSTSSNTQISGGNKFYPNRDEIGGYISVVLNNATYIGSNIILSGEKKSDGVNPNCEFSIGKYSIIYRQIELSNPFIQPGRTIGQNWKDTNRKYDFTGIIDSEIWSNEKNYEYRYDISKVDVNNIKKDTSSVGVDSYLGQECIFNNAKWICSFVRPTSGQNGKNQFFTNINLNLDKINK